MFQKLLNPITAYQNKFNYTVIKVILLHKKPFNDILEVKGLPNTVRYG